MTEPMPLPEGFLPCLACGVAVRDDGRERVYFPRGDFTLPPESPTARRLFESGQDPAVRCDDCTRVRDRAQSLLDEHPAVRARIGARDIALHRVELAVSAFDALGLPVPPIKTDRDVWLALEHLTIPGGLARRANARSATTARWAHLSDTQREALREGVAGHLHARIERPVPIHAPGGGGCLFCGVGAVEALPSRAGEVWHEHRAVDRGTLGGTPSPVRFDGWLCPVCHSSVVTEGSIGPTARERALAAYFGVRTPGLGAVELVGLVGWGALPGAEPNSVPWEHIGNLDDVRARLASAAGEDQAFWSRGAPPTRTRGWWRSEAF